MSGPTLRDVHWTDVAALARLEAEVFPHDAWSETSWWAELAARPRREYVVADAGAAPDAGPAAGGHLAGYAGLDHAGDTSDVMTMAVSPTHRGAGLGHRLLEDLVRRAARRGAAHLMLEVRADNDAAVALYQAHGFGTLSRRRGYYPPDGVDALVMRKALFPNGSDDD